MSVDVPHFRKQAEILRVNSAGRAADLLDAALDEIVELRGPQPAKPNVDPDTAFAILACRLTGWEGVALRLEQGWKPDADTNEGKLIALAAEHVARYRIALEQIASARIAGWGAEGAVKSFNDVVALAHRTLKGP